LGKGLSIYNYGTPAVKFGVLVPLSGPLAVVKEIVTTATLTVEIGWYSFLQIDGVSNGELKIQKSGGIIRSEKSSWRS
jgi:hypothetical protein